MIDGKLCCFCYREIDKYHSNDITPIKVVDDRGISIDKAKCCEYCNKYIVIPTRINIMNIIESYKGGKL